MHEVDSRLVEDIKLQVQKRMGPLVSNQSRTSFLSLSHELRHQILDYTLQNVFTWSGRNSARQWSDTIRELDSRLTQDIEFQVQKRMGPLVSNQSQTSFLSLPREIRHLILAHTYSNYEYLTMLSNSVFQWSLLLRKVDRRLHENIKFQATKRVEAITTAWGSTEVEIEDEMKEWEEFYAESGFDHFRNDQKATR